MRILSTQVLRLLGALCILSFPTLSAAQYSENDTETPPPLEDIKDDDKDGPETRSFFISDAKFPDTGDIQKRYNSYELSALTNDLAGDHIDLDTGALSLSATDVSLPGNNGLTVEFSRTLSRDLSGDRWGSWVLGIPSFSRNYLAQVGANSNRCTGQLYPDDPYQYGISPAIFVPAASYWHGYNLKIPGRSPGKPAGYAAGGSSAEFSGTSARMVTKNNWLIKCGPTASDGGQGYEVVAPNGDTYTFTRVRTRPVRTVTVSYYDPNQPTGTGGPTPNATIDLTMMEETLLVSRVEDVHGNYVDYTDTSISSSDGRTITFGGSASVKTVTANGRTWTYNFTGGELTQVTLPDGRTWQYSIPGDAFNEVLTSICAHHNSTTLTPIQVTHPSGTQIEFDRTVIRNGRTHMDVILVDPGTPPPSLEQCHIGHTGRVTATGFYSWAITEKTLTPPTGPSFSYQYDYEQDFGSYNDATSHPADTKERTVTDPLGHKTVYRFNRRNGPKEGSMESVQIIPAGTSTAISTTNHTYATGNSVGADYTSGLSNGASTTRIYKTATVVQQDGDTYTTNWTFQTNEAASDFAYNSPTTVSSFSNVSTTPRTTTYYYEHKKTNWVLSLPDRVVQNGRELSTAVYNPEGQPEIITRYGTGWQTISYNGDGTLNVITDAIGRKTRGSNWKRGKPQTIERAYQSIEDEITEHLTVDNNGWVTSVTDGEGYVTAYGHDNMGRLTSIDPPGSWTNTTINYNFTGGGAVQTVTKGNAVNTITFDGFYRPVLRRAQALDTGWSSYTKTSYDSLGRKAFESFPSTSSNPTQGTNMTYDALDRVLSETENVTPFASTSYYYHSFHRTRVTDPEGNQTTTFRDGYSGPGKGDIRNITQPMGVNTAIYRNVWGEVDQVLQYGNHNGYNVSAAQFFYYDTRRNLCRYRTPEGGNTLMFYNNAGEMTSYAKGISGTGTNCATPSGSSLVTLGYDDLGRLETTNYTDANTPNITRTYDDNSNLLTVNRGSGGTAVNWTYAWNSINLPTSEQLDIDGLNFDQSYTYNNDGNLTQQTLPSGHSLTYLPDALGRKRVVYVNGGWMLDQVTWHPNASVSNMRYRNNFVTTRTLTARQQPLRVRAVNGGTTAMDLTYGYNARGLVTSITDAADAPNSRTYGYDALSRLTTASGPWGSGSYTYDPLGNLRAKTLGSRNVTISYDATKNRVSQSVDTGTSGTRSFAYDARGNATTVGSLAFVYDMADQPRAVSSGVNGNYRYDGNLKRVRAQVDGKTIYNVYDLSGRLVHVDKVTDGEATNYVSGPDGVFARITNSAITYMHNDHLGSSSSGRNAWGVLQWTERYSPYGEALLSPTANDDLAGFTGHIRDKATGLNYMQARYQDPVIGRFLSIDPVTFMEAEHPGYVSRYAYSMNDPVNSFDPTGGACVGACQIVLGTHVRAATSNPKSYATGMARGAPRAITSTADMVLSYGPGSTSSSRALANSPMGATNAYNDAIGPGDGSIAMALGEQTGEVAAEFAGGGLGVAKTLTKATAKSVLSVADDAAGLANQIGKNSVTIPTAQGAQRFDLTGAAHKGVPTPHVQGLRNNTNPETGETFLNKVSSDVRPMTREDLDTVRDHLDNQ